MYIPLIVLGAGIMMIACEIVRPDRSWPRVAGWGIRATGLNGVQGLMVLTAGVAWDQWMIRHRLWSADGLGIAGGGVVGYLAITFVYYWLHRWRHESAFLWRWIHQVHHSPQRIEVITSFYKHPFELLVNSVLSSFIVYLVVGLGPQAASYAVLLTGLAELFYHWNVPTPYWLGFIVQRPESHCIHHQDGLHSYNYADLPIWDMLFGTFRNPRHWQARCGFGAKEHQFVAMLAGKDLNQSEAIETQT